MVFSRTDLSRAVRNPSLVGVKLRESAVGLQNALNRRRFGAPADPMADDWDTLVLLDACRYDVFERAHSLSGRLESRVSPGSSSQDFLENALVGEQYHDTVYVTANPFVGLLEPGTLHAVHPLLEEWDETLGTVRPGPVTAAVREAHERYPHKRLIVHYMQPHQPYLGETGAAIRREVAAAGGAKGWDRRRRSSPEDIANTLAGIKSLEAPRHPDVDVSRATVRRAYRETLDIVLDHVGDLLADLDGRTVISADHGEHLGERPFRFGGPRYGHSPGVWTTELREVPWFAVPSESRRRVTADPPERVETPDPDDLTEKLAALGYT